MTKNRFFKIVIAIMLALTVFMILSNSVFALPFNIDEQFENTGDKSNATNTTAGIIGTVINFFQVVASGIALIMLIVIAIKWIYASPSGKVQMAKTIRYYVLGAVLIFTAVALLQIAKNFAEKLI